VGRSREQQREYMRAYRARKREEAAAAKASEPKPAAPSVTPDAPPPPPRSTRHADAVERMLQETGLGRLEEEGPLVELLRDLAVELDEAPIARTRQQYLTALRDARRVLAAAPGAAGVGGASVDKPDAVPAVATEPVVPEIDPEVADFESFRRAKGGSSAG